MIALLQRVSRATVSVDDIIVGDIGQGVLVFAAAERDDENHHAERLAQRVLAYRLFADDTGRMNHNVLEAGGQILAVPQFTLAADTRRGNRPGFHRALGGDAAAGLFDVFVDTLSRASVSIATGRFGAEMQVALVNDGPVTFWLTAP